MTDRPRPRDDQSDEGITPDQAPELHNAEQEDEGDQAHTVAIEALNAEARRGSPLDSTKGPGQSGLLDDSTQDLIDHMRDMEQSGRIDMSAYSGEPNHDDNDDTFGDASKLDDLPSDGADEGNSQNGSAAGR
jgi:hypothetical protein